MTPIADIKTDRRAGFVELDWQTARQEVRSRSQADWAATDHGDREGLQSGVIHIPSFRDYRNNNQRGGVLCGHLSSFAGASGVDATLID